MLWHPDPVHKKNSLIDIKQNVMFYILFFIRHLPNLMCLHTQHVSMMTVGSARVLVYSEPPGILALKAASQERQPGDAKSAVFPERVWKVGGEHETLVAAPKIGAKVHGMSCSVGTACMPSAVTAAAFPQRLTLATTTRGLQKDRPRCIAPGAHITDSA